MLTYWPASGLQPGHPQGPVQPRQRRTCHDDGGTLERRARDRSSCSSRRVFVAWMSEILVGAVEHASQSLGMNAGLHRGDRGADRGQRRRALDGGAGGDEEPDGPGRGDRDGLGACRSRCSWRRSWSSPATCGPSRWTCVFTSLEVVAVILGVLIARMVAEDGESNWLEGADAADGLRDPGHGVLLPARTAEAGAGRSRDRDGPISARDLRARYARSPRPPARGPC